MSAPHDELAERAVIGAMISSESGASQVLSLLVASDFYDPRHGLIFEAVARAREAGTPVDPTSVLAAMTADGTIRRAGGGSYLLDCHAAAVATAPSLAFVANCVAEHAQMRALVLAASEILTNASAPSIASSEELTTWAAERIAAVARGTGAAADDDDAWGETELEMAEGPTNWVIPQLLARGDRLMLTGHEGGGKSQLIRQFAIATAAGVDSLHGRHMSPARVMVLDCENSASLSRKCYRPLLKTAREEGAGVEDRFRLHLQPGGLDLTQRAGIGWLLRRVEKFNPDLLCIGPLYRLHLGDPSDERDARRIAAALDRAREISGAALILEGHSPHLAANTRKRNVRPVGSSLWLRWPEFGYGLRLADEERAEQFRVCDFVSWRGPRDERNWPRKIRAGSPWPWVLDQPQRRGW